MPVRPPDCRMQEHVPTRAVAENADNRLTHVSCNLGLILLKATDGLCASHLVKVKEYV